jgi:altronate hydrolase
VNERPRQWIVASPSDSVATAIAPLTAGLPIDANVILKEAIGAGHKFALRSLAAGDPVIKFGQTIGVATRPITAGELVHTQNLASIDKTDRSSVGKRQCNVPSRSVGFMGYVRPDGAVGTRNFIGVLTTVNCSATVARRIADHFTAQRLASFPNVDGVVAFSHASGCGMAKQGAGIDNLRRTIAGYASHPNFAAVLLVGLGCEVNQAGLLLDSQSLAESSRVRTLSIQDSGGTRAAIDAGIAEIERLLAVANTAARQPVSAAHLKLGLQCGASDGYSALTANPALGRSADLVVAAGGAVVLSETPEIFGAENLLLDRAASEAVGRKLVERLEWWESYAAQNGISLDNNPSPGNIAGGITTILEKSLGAVAKSGSTPLNDVIGYAERIRVSGLTFMDTPGYDPCSATGQIAGGANLIAFTTGRGSVFGSKPAPTIKLASNSDLARRMPDDIDIDCGRLLSGETDLDRLGEEIFARMLRVASGERTASEINDIGDNEFVPWVPGAAL